MIRESGSGSGDAPRRRDRDASTAMRIPRRGEIDRDRLLRTLTFWLRPEFVLRVIAGFQRVAGFDRSIALASSALTATIPLAIVISAVTSRLGGKATADRIIDRYGLTGGGAEAVRDALSPPSGVTTSIGVLGALFLMITVLSFTRVVQRMVEQTWELPPLSVRNSANGLLWIGGLMLYIALNGFIRGLIGVSSLDIVAAAIIAPLTVVFLVWSATVLSARRLTREALLPFGFVGAVLLAIYSVGAEVYMPHLFNTYATRYGVIGAVFALISAFFCIMLILVVSAAAGREIHEELGRIRRGERPAEDEVRRQWETITTEALSRWQTVRVHLRRNRDERG
jgi:uncharacterized BrkB/YihY/UPF0761 family membrane protein